jgi:hypothetical protein
MLNVFLKDVRAGAIFLWAVIPLNGVLALQVSRSGGAFLWANVACAALILVAVSMLDWKCGLEPFVHSLPVTRAAVVRGRYLTAIAVGLLSLTVAAVVGVARALGLLSQGGAWPRWVAGDMALAFLLAYAVVAAIYLPCYYRWGFGKGNVAAALAVAAGVIVADLAGRASPELPSPSGSGPISGGMPAGLIPQGVARLAGHYGLAAGGVVVLLVAAGLLWASSQLAVRAYRNREF